ncbi:MAG: hypothetical protein OXC72_02370 [Roseovarius sp.]|nr:hypothetical protein [Roseovarius sp.]MCY4290590.1 hypothetical protein [Roseovarius sp.]
MRLTDFGALGVMSRPARFVMPPSGGAPISPRKSSRASFNATGRRPDRFRMIVVDTSAVSELRVTPRLETSVEFEMLSQPAELRIEALRLLGPGYSEHPQKTFLQGIPLIISNIRQFGQREVQPRASR